MNRAPKARLRGRFGGGKPHWAKKYQPTPSDGDGTSLFLAIALVVAVGVILYLAFNPTAL